MQKRSQVVAYVPLIHSKRYSISPKEVLPLVRHLMLKNFSMPMSAPNPASVTRSTGQQTRCVCECEREREIYIKIERQGRDRG